MTAAEVIDLVAWTAVFAVVLAAAAFVAGLLVVSVLNLLEP